MSSQERGAAIAFTARDGTRLVGLLLGSGGRAVVFAHAFGSDLCSWLPFARTLAARGYRVLDFDFRGFGSSGFPQHGSNADRFEWDLGAAVRAVRSRGARRVVLVGASVGATAVVVAASEVRPAVDGVISVSPFAISLGRPDHGLSPLTAVRGSRVPLLLVASAGDASNLDNARALVRAARALDKRLVVVRGAAHGTDLLAGGSGSHVRSVLESFIRAHT